MAREAPPVTPAVRALRAAKVDFTPHLYAYENGGKRGFLVGIAPTALTGILGATPVAVAVPS